MVSVVIDLSVEARVDPGLDAHGLIQHGQGASVGLVADHLAPHGVNAPHRAVHQSYHVQGATVQIGLAIRVPGEVDRRDTQAHGRARLEAVLSVDLSRVDHGYGDHVPHHSGQNVVAVQVGVVVFHPHGELAG